MTVAVRGTTGYLANLLGITSSLTKNPLEEWLFCQELPIRGIYRKKGCLAGNYQPIDEESTKGMGICWELLAHGC
jgi:hypothetical protein